MKFASRDILVGSTALLVVLQTAATWAQTTEPIRGSAVKVDTLGESSTSEENSDPFIRLARDVDERPLALQTATARYESKTGKGKLIVDLVGAVHIGDHKYYSQLNDQFEQYDVVLYELVAPAGTTIPKGGRSESVDNPISMLQGMAQSMLGLDSQMDHINYTAANFVHADMSPTEMAEAMRKRGDNAVTFALSALSDVLRQANLQAEEMARRQKLKPLGAEAVEEPVDLMTMLTDASAGSRLKIQLAEQFSTMSAPGMSLGPTLDRSIVKDRNAAAMRVFQQQLAAGNQRIAIFYGAAHMPDFEERLVRDFGLQRTRTDWLTAWDLTVKPAKTESPLSLMLRMLNSQ